MSSGVNHNINGANHVKWSESQYRWSESHQVLCSLVKIEGVNQDIVGAKCRVVQYFVV